VSAAGNILALAGGVGGAKLAHGLAMTLAADRLTVAVNTGDDFQHMGLYVSPDLDTVMYTLAEIANQETGWGIAGETWNFMKALERIGGETWFQLGDADLATHAERTRRLAAGEALSTITAALCNRLGIDTRIVPMTDHPVRTMIHAADRATLPFQDYFVRLKCAPVIAGVAFAGAEAALIEGGKLDAIVICPSNPYVSVDPILAVPAIGAFLAARTVPVVAVSPIVGGAAIKGPAAKMMGELGVDVSALGVARHYQGRIDGLIIDAADAALAEPIEALGMKTLVTGTVMGTAADKARLANETLAFAMEISACQERK